MTTVETHYEHIVLEDDRVRRIAGTAMKVVELVTAQQAHDWSPEGLAFQFPSLTLDQIHSALAYYWDHQAALDEEIARRLALTDELQHRAPTPPVALRLRRRPTA